MRGARSLALCMSLVLIGFAAVKLFRPLEVGALSIAAIQVEAGSNVGLAFQFGVAILELGIGIALVIPSWRNAGALSAGLFGVVCACGAFVDLLTGSKAGCGCLGSVSLPIAARLLTCGAFCIGGVSILGRRELLPMSSRSA
jgi:hypothetical protein